MMFARVDLKWMAVQTHQGSNQKQVQVKKYVLCCIGIVGIQGTVVYIHMPACGPATIVLAIN